MFYPLLIIKALRSTYALLATASRLIVCSSEINTGWQSLHSELCGLSKSYGSGYIFYCMIWFFIFYLGYISSLLSVDVFLLLSPLCNFFRTKFDIGPYFMFLAGDLILDDIVAENSEKFPDIKKQTCLKRSKCKTVTIWKALWLSSKLVLQLLGFSTAQCTHHAVVQWHQTCFLCLWSCLWAGNESSSSKCRIYSSQNLLSCCKH